MVEKCPIFLSGNGEKKFIDNITPLLGGEGMVEGSWIGVGLP